MVVILNFRVDLIFFIVCIIVICVEIFVRFDMMDVVKDLKFSFLVVMNVVSLLFILLNVDVNICFVVFVMLLFCVIKLFSVCDVFRV